MDDVKILCVDDEKNVLKSLGRLFLDTDYEIFTADSGDEGLQILQENEGIQLVISDYRMPKMNGVEFLRSVYEKWPHTIRIVLSGYADTVAIVEAVNEGKIYKFIPKPWNDDELKITLSKALDHYFTNQQNIKLAGELEIKNRELQEINNNLEKLVEERTADLVVRNKILAASQNILDTLPLAVVGIDPGGMIVQCNKKGLELFHIDEGNIVGLDRSESFPDEVNEFIDKVNEQGVLTKPYANNGTSVIMKGVHMVFEGGQEGVILVFDEGGAWS